MTQDVDLVADPTPATLARLGDELASSVATTTRATGLDMTSRSAYTPVQLPLPRQRRTAPVDQDGGLAIEG